MLIAHAVQASLVSLSLAGLHPEAESITGTGTPGQSARFGIVPASNMQLLSHLDISELDPQFGSFSANDCWGYVTPQGREIAIIGLRAATAFVDITDPYQPAVIGTFESPWSLWRDIKVLDTYAYAVSEGGGYIQVFDLEQADAGVVADLGFTFNLPGASTTHNIAIDEDSGVLYRLGSGGSLQAYTVGARGQSGSPTQPDQTIIDPGFYVHDAQIVTYDSGPYAGRQIGFLCTGRGALRIWDLTDKNNPFEISSLNYPGRRYNHQGWLDEDRRYFYINDEFNNAGGTKMFIINVEDLENPEFVGVFQNGNTSDAHNLYIRGNRVYAANYRSGLRVHDISNRENPVEIAWIDTYPSDDQGGYDGAWSNYPYFPSGNIIVSDIQSGLFVARLDIDSVVLQPANEMANVWSPGGGTPIRLRAGVGDTTIDEASVELVIVESDGTQTRLAAGYAEGLVSVDTPPLACGQGIDWWVELDTTDGQTFGFPAPGGVKPAQAIVADRVAPVFYDDAESDPGWTTSATASDGGWTRGVPVNALRGDPLADADGSGSAWLTDNSSSNGGNSDVDSGAVTLTSPVFGPLAGGALSFSYWLSDTDASPLGEGDGLSVEVNELDGLGWRAVRSYAEPDGVWRTDRLMPGVDIPSAAAFQIRFIAADLNTENVVEAGVDAVSFSIVECLACDNRADVNGDGFVDPADFNAWVTAFNTQSPECDQNGDGLCNPADFNAWVANYEDGC